MAFTVYENNIPTHELAKRMNLANPVWHQREFQTHREAEIFAYLWAYPVTLEAAKALAPAMRLNKKYDYSTYNNEGPHIMMEIREVK